MVFLSERHVRPLHLVFAVLPLWACSSGDVTGDEGCVDETAVEQSLLAQMEDSTWREQVINIAEAAPEDSVFEAVIMFDPADEGEVRRLLSAVKATITYDFQTLSALSIAVPAEALIPLADSPSIQLLSFGSPVVPFTCT